MSVVYDRIYIRFKGRVLGPLAHDKVLDLVARGQITRDHDMSSDAVNWAKASDFASFFPQAQPQSVNAPTNVESRPPANDETSTPANESWFLNIDGDAVKSFDEPAIKAMIAEGKLQSSHQLWNQNTGVWQNIGDFRPQWFSGRSSVTEVAGATNVDWKPIGEQLLTSRPWLNLLSILGLIVSSIVFLLTTGVFFFLIVDDYSVAFKIGLVIAILGQVVAALAWLNCFIRMLKLSGMLLAVKFRNEPTEISTAIAGQSALWRSITVTFLLWIFATVVGLLSVVIAWQLQSSEDSEHGLLPVSVAKIPAV